VPAFFYLLIEVEFSCAKRWGVIKMLSMFQLHLSAMYLILTGHMMESKEPKGGLSILQLLGLLAVIGIVLTVVLNYLR
jgi:hypothetical protein